MRKYDKQEPKIYQNIRGRWKVRFYDDDKQSYCEKICETKTDAENLKRAMLRNDDLSYWFVDKVGTNHTPITFEELAEKWLDHGEHVRRISLSCLINYRSHLRNHVFPVFGKTQVRKLMIEDLERLARIINQKAPKTRSYTAVRKSRWDASRDDGLRLSLSFQREILTVACMITSWAYKRRPKLIHENPF